MNKSWPEAREYDTLEITHFLKSPQAERHLVLPIANAGSRPAAHFARARASRGSALSPRSLEFDKVIPLSGYS